MQIRSDFHVHTKLCDGRDTPEEMAATAYALGFHTLGFSEHSADYSGLDICLDEARAAQYRSIVRSLQAEYAG